MLDLIQALIERNPAAGLDLIHAALDAGTDPRQFARQVVDYLRGLLLISSGSTGQVDATVEIRRQMDLHAQALTIPDLLRFIRIFNSAANEKRSSWQASLPLELALLEALEQPASQVQAAHQAAPAASAAAPPPRSAPPAPAPKSSSSTPRQVAGSPETGDDPNGPQGPQDRQDTQALSESWQRILNWVRRQNPRAYGLLNSCKSRYVRGDVLVLNFASDLLKNSMEKPENLELIRQALQQVFQRPMEVQVTVNHRPARHHPPGCRRRRHGRRRPARSGW